MEEGLIEKYLNNEMSPEEREAFEKRLDQEPELAQEYRIFLAVKKGIKDYTREKLKDHFNTLGKSPSSEPPMLGSEKAEVLSMWPYLKWAVMRLVIREPNRDQLFREYYEPYPNYELAIERGQEMESIYGQAFLAYELEEYQNAIDLFGQLPIEEPGVAFYLASSFLALGKLDKAAEYFRKSLGLTASTGRVAPARQVAV